jgi:hypothetical protein
MFPCHRVGTVGEFAAPGSRRDTTMQPPSADQLITLLTQCEESSEEQRDELLREFLVQAYPTRQTQDG